MKNYSLHATARSLTGKNKVKQVRKEHFIPGVLYGNHMESQSIKISKNDFEKFNKLQNPGSTLNLVVDGKETFVLFKELQFNFLKHETVHVEFQLLSAGEKIKIQVPIIFIEKDKIPSGLILQELNHEVEMYVLPKDIIENIVVDLTDAKLGDHVSVADLEIFNNTAYEILDDSSKMVYTITEPNLQVEKVEEVESTPLYAPTEEA